MAAPRCTRVAKVMLQHAETLSRAVKRNGAVQYTWSRPAPVSLAKHVHLALHMCTTRYSRSSPTVVQDDEYTAGPNRHLDGRPGGRARPAKHSRPAGGAARVQENHNIACIPVRRACSDRLGSKVSVER